MRHVRLGSTVAAALLAALVGCSSARTLEESASTASECARCHGFPPSAPNSPDHPAVASNATACAVCHSDTVDSNGEIIAGGAHQNGQVDFGTHPVPYVDQHTPAALASIQACAACHGSDYGGVEGVAPSCNACHASIASSAPDWKQNCSWCHGTRTAGVTSATVEAAPPQAVSGGDATSANPRVGAHRAHLSDGPLVNALPCSSCHQVPTTAQALSHFQGGGARGAITFDALAQQGGAGAYDGISCSVYCHGSGAGWPAGSNGDNIVPAWTGGPAEAGCGTCHGVPPTTGPTINNVPVHLFHFASRNVTCNRCHDGYLPVNKAIHVNGTRDAIVIPRGGGTLRIDGWDCDACHNALGVD